MQHHGHGLAEDLERFLRLRQRRKVLRWLGAGALAPLAGCGGGGDEGTEEASVDATSAAATDGATCSLIPSETSGPYPGDGTNTGSGGGIANALTLSGIVRSDISASFDTASGQADGVPLSIELQLVNASDSCATLAGYAVYLWHCDALGRYSMYTSAIADENYLRGVQVADSEGIVRFTSIFPGCYAGRWPHIHFEVFSSLARATSGNNDLKTSQIALPASAASAVYADARYTGSTANFARASLASDSVFSDGVTLQVPSVSGSTAEGYAISLRVGVAP